MNRSQLYTLLLLTLLFPGCSSKPSKPDAHEPPKGPTVSVGEKPATSEITTNAKPTTIQLDHKYFVITYDTKFRLARYVRYVATVEKLKQGNAKRKNRFFPDPLLKKAGFDPVQKKEYLHTGYDQGHLAPSGDFTWSQEVNDETFVLSNMVPQSPNLNRDAWRRLEAHVRNWGCGEGRIIVFSGPILEEGLKKLGGKLPVPKEFFKLVIDDTPPRKAIAFLYGQGDKGDVYKQRVTDIQALVKRIGQNFEAEVPEEDKKIFRQAPKIEDWKEIECKGD